MAEIQMAEHETLNLDALPDLPQSALLKQLAPGLWAAEGVVAMWLGGSLATGTADRYSDVDLFLAVAPEHKEAWLEPDLSALFQGQVLARRYSRFGEDLHVHHLLLASGEVYDLHVQPAEATFRPQPRLILGCRDPELRAVLEQSDERHEFWPASVYPLTVKELIEVYWHDAHKQRKVLYRDLRLVALHNLRLAHGWFLRLAYVRAADRDCGDLRYTTIYGLTPVARALQASPAGREALRVVGMPTRTRAEIVAAIDALHEQVAHVGRELAERYEVEYPEELERVVLEGWAAFKLEWRM